MCYVIKHIRVNNRKYSFGNEEGAYDWVCSKVPDNGRIKKDCVPKVGSKMDALILVCKSFV